MASKRQPVVRVRMQEELLRKLIVLAQSEGRSLNNQINMLARNAVAYHERAKGRIDPRAMAVVELGEYFEEE